MIDEMSMGLAPLVVARLLPVVRRIATDTRLAVLLVEQHVDAALAVCKGADVLSHGQLAAAGAVAARELDRKVLASSDPGPRPSTRRTHTNRPTGGTSDSRRNV